MRPLTRYLFTKRFYFVHTLLLAALLVVNSACVRMQELSDGFEYNPSKKRELSELKTRYELFNRMEDIDVALHLCKRDFLSLVNDSFKDFSEHFTSLDAGEFSNVHFGSMKFHLSNQQIISQIEFSLQVDGLQREIHGHVMATHRLEAATNRFVLKTDFDEIVVDSIDGTKVVNKNSENIKLIEKAAKNFMGALNVEIVNMPLEIPVDLNILSGVNGKDVFVALGYKLHSAKSINMRTKMQMYLPYICKNGVVFLGSDTIMNTAKVPDKDMDIKELGDLLRKKIDASLHKSMGVSLEVLQNESGYYVSKNYLSKQMNSSLKDIDLRMINKFFLKIQEGEQNLSQKIYFSGKDRLPSCEGVAKDCTKTQQQCNRNCSRSFGIDKCASCDRINNPFEKVRCMSKYEACRSKEELHLYACLKEEERCTLANVRADNVCRQDNLAGIATCEAKKKKVLFINNTLELAKVDLNLGVSNSYAIQRIHRIRFDKDFSGLEVERNLHLSVDSSLKFGLETAGTEDINCTLTDTGPLFVHSFADRMNVLRHVPVFSESHSDGALIIKAKSDGAVMPIKLENSPSERLLASEEPLLRCTYQKMPLRAITAEEVLLEMGTSHLLDTMSGQIRLTFEDEAFSFRIAPVKIGKDLFFYPRMQEKSIVFKP